MVSIDGVYQITKIGTFIRLKRAGGEGETQTIDYFTFNSSLFQYFDLEKINKIMGYLNENKSVIIDFDQEKAMLIKDKDPSFMSLFRQEFDPQTIANYYDEIDGNTDDNNYNKPNLGDDTYVESIYRRSANS